MPKGDKLTAKQQAFVAAIIEGKGPSEAYRTAYDAGGMTPKAVCVNAAKLLKHTSIALAIEAGRAEREAQEAAATKDAADKAGVDREWIITRLAHMAGFDLTEAATWGPDGKVTFIESAKLSDASRLAMVELVQEISPKGATSIKLKMGDKLGALKALAQILGLTKDQTAGAVGTLKLNISV